MDHPLEIVHRNSKNERIHLTGPVIASHSNLSQLAIGSVAAVRGLETFEGITF